MPQLEAWFSGSCVTPLNRKFLVFLASFALLGRPQEVLGAAPVDKLLFTLNAGEAYHVALMNADGTDVVDIANCGDGECYPNWSPDGSRIVFERHDDKGAAIYLMHADGSHQQRLSPTPGTDVRPCFSPSGKQIIFNRVVGHNFSGVPETEIMIMDADGTSRHVLLPANGVFNIEPRISPDGTKIVFMSNRDRSQQIYVMNADGTHITKITDQGSNGDPNWSPDGARLSFGSTREGGGRLNIYTMKPDGSDIRPLTYFLPPVEAGDTGWSPDGKTIAFERDVNGRGQSDTEAKAEIWTVASDGSGQAVSTHQTCAPVGCSPRFKPR